MKILGVEGEWSSAEPLTWGAAVLDLGTEIANSLSRLRSAKSKLNDYAFAGAIHRLRPIEIGSTDAWGSVLLLLRKSTTANLDRFAPSAQGQGLLESGYTKDFRWYLFGSLAAFSEHADSVAARVFQEVAPPDVRRSPESADLLAIAMLFAPRDSRLLALRANQAGTTAVAARLLRARAADPDVFDGARRALTNDLDAYMLKYSGGQAEGGGLPASVAAQKLRDVVKVDRALVPVVRAQFPKFAPKNLPEIHTQEMVAASATFHFTAGDADDPVATLMGQAKLRLFKEALDGHIPPALLADRGVISALNRLAKPDPETQVEHAFGGKGTPFAPIKYEPTEDGSYSPREVLRCLGYLEGVFNRQHKIEAGIVLSTNIELSTSDDGHGQIPAGVSILQASNDFLYTPAIFTIQRFEGLKGELRVYLKALEILGPEPAEIDAIPSHIGGMLFHCRAVASFAADRLEVRQADNTSPILEILTGRTAPQAAAWREKLGDRARPLELAAASAGSWIQVAKTPRIQPWQRTAIWLLENATPESPKAWVPRIASLREKPQYFRFDERSVALSPMGLAMASVLRRVYPAEDA